MFFFFKQTTAYEMRISDWSSDVCSSDLWSASARSVDPADPRPQARQLRLDVLVAAVQVVDAVDGGLARCHQPRQHQRRRCAQVGRHHRRAAERFHPAHDRGVPLDADVRAQAQQFRSEEHTSELQSLMRISYAVFCLKKKKKTT